MSYFDNFDIDQISSNLAQKLSETSICLKLLFEKKNYILSLPKITKDNEMNFFKWSKNEPLKINKYAHSIWFNTSGPSMEVTMVA